MQKRIVRSNGVNLAVYESGAAQGPTIVFVHGYPDEHGVWSHVIALLEGEYRCIAYDVRGAGESDAPADVDAYALDCLSRDLRNVLDAVSPDQPVHLVGHDWGSIQTWESVTDSSFRGRIASFTSISGPCLDHVGADLRDKLRVRSPRALREVASQLLKSWYIGMFHIPGLADRAWRRGGLDKRFPQMLLETEGVVAERSPTRASDGANGIKLYRANMRARLSRPRNRHAAAPVQVIVPTHDRYVGPSLIAPTARWTTTLERHDVDAGHWVILSDAPRIASLIRSFVSRTASRQA